MIGDHYLHKKALPFEGSVRIPFMILPPKGQNAAKGFICSQPVSHIDIMPTVLELAGVSSRYPMDGTSLVPQLHGQDRFVRQYLHGEHANAATGWQYLVNQDEKYAWETLSGQEFYFELKSDPQETHNAVDDPQYLQQVMRMRALLADILSLRPQDGLTENGTLIPGRLLPDCRSELIDRGRQYD